MRRLIIPLVLCLWASLSQATPDAALVRQLAAEDSSDKVAAIRGLAQAADPDAASRRIDAIQSTLGGTTQWIRDQKRLSGELAEALEGSPPPVLEMERN